MGKREPEDKPDPAEKPEPEKDEPEEDTPRVPPSRKKTGEAPDNLRRREEWFRKRSS